MQSSTIDVCFVRHGETEANRDNIRQGHCDFPITPKGLQGAELTGHVLRDINWTAIYSSDLKRAYDTAQIIMSKSLAPNKREICTMYDLRERKYGIREGYDKYLSVEKVREMISESRGIPLEEIVDDAESLADVHIRQERFVSHLCDTMIGGVSENTTDGSIPRVLVVSHGGFIRAFLEKYAPESTSAVAPLENTPQGQRVKVGNCSITIVRITRPQLNEQNSVSPRMKALVVSCTEHLRPDTSDSADSMKFLWPN